MANNQNLTDQEKLMKSVVDLTKELDYANEKYEELSETQKKTLKGQEQYIELLKLESKLREGTVKLGRESLRNVDEEKVKLKEVNSILEKITEEYEEQKKLQTELETLTQDFVKDLNGALGLVNDLGESRFR